MIKFIKKILKKIYQFYLCNKYKNISQTSYFRPSVKISNKKNLYMAEFSSIGSNSLIINSRANVIFKKGAYTGPEVMIVTGGHMSVKGMWFIDVTNDVKDKLDKDNWYDKDIIVEEDSWIGGRAILLKGSHIGRGCIIGGGAVIRTNIPPYAVVIGNPGKIVKFRFNPNEAIEHEKQLYPEPERLSLDILEQNYRKYYLDKIDEINTYLNK